jgi:S1-C subfamily serine protease
METFKMKLLIPLIFNLLSTAACADSISQYVYRMYNSEKRIGTGFALTTPKGNFLVTNWHVCYTSTDGYMIAAHKVENTPIVVKVKILKIDPKIDLCILAFNRPGLKLADKHLIGSKVRSVGYPGSSVDQVVSYGESINRLPIELPYLPTNETCPASFKRVDLIDGQVLCKGTIDVIDTSLKTEGGSSGSPVVNGEDEVVGVINSTRNSKDGVLGSMIPLDNVKTFVSSF